MLSNLMAMSKNKFIYNLECVNLLFQRQGVFLRNEDRSVLK